MLDARPRCTIASERLCAPAGCRAALDGGVLAIDTAAGGETHRIVTADAAKDAALLQRVTTEAWTVDAETPFGTSTVVVSDFVANGVEREIVGVRSGELERDLDPGLAIGPVDSATSEARERRDRVEVTSGTLDGGGRAAVIRVDTRSREHAADPWRPTAHVAVCTLDAAPRCTPAVTVACADHGCRARLDAGVLTIETASGADSHRVTD